MSPSQPASPKSRKRTPQEWLALAERAAYANDIKGALVAYREAARGDRRNAGLHYNVAVACERLGDIDAAAAALTTALAVHPDHGDSAARLARLAGRFQISPSAGLDARGLRAALLDRHVERQPIVDLTLRLLAHEGPLAEVMDASRSDPQAAAATLFSRPEHPALRDERLLCALKAGVVRHPGIEAVLTAVRRILLLELPRESLVGRHNFELAVALLVQLIRNEYVWAETAEETAAIGRLSIDRDGLLGGDIGAGAAFLLRSLYRPIGETLPHLTAAQCAGLRPRSLKEAVAAEAAWQERLAGAMAGIPSFGEVHDPVSIRVRARYEASPYPRWDTVHKLPAGSLKAALTRYVSTPRLAFMDGPFDVLVAGAGSGQQALQSALAYGPNARLTALDLSVPSLAYGKLKASELGIANVEMIAGDLMDARKLGRTFDIIECVGVLHHMADPWEGWRALLGLLAPHGLMYVGLYSATARDEITSLRQEPGHPGADCSAEEARAYRASLMRRPDGAPGRSLAISHDFYTLSEFRDLVLHPSEVAVGLDAVGAFLAREGLAFRGFTLPTPVLEAFRSQFPDSGWPGRLEDWTAFEAENPRTFDAMYRFWCDRGAA